MARAHAARLEAQEARERLAELLESITDAFLAVDRGWRITYANHAAELILARPREQLPGVPLLDALPLLRGPDAHQRIERVMAERAAVSFDLEDAAAGRWYAAHAYPSAAGLSLHLHDVTERRRAEQALRFLAEASAALADSLDTTALVRRVVSLVVPRLGDWCLLMLVDDARRPTAVETGAASAVTAERLMEAADRLQRTAVAPAGLVGVALAAPEPEIVDLTEGWPVAGDPLEAVGAAACLLLPLPGPEGARGALLLAREAGRHGFRSEEAQAAASLGRRAAMSLENARLYEAERRATRLRDDVLGIVAHDLRNPLNAITMSASALRALGTSPEDAPLREKTAASILRGADRMSRLIADLLDAGRLESGWTPARAEPLEVARLLEAAIEPFLRRADEQKVALRCQPCEGRLRGEEPRLVQVLGNLLDNALKLTPAGGEISVDAAPRPDGILISVADTGPGITEDAMPHLFDRFWQAKAAGRAGAGLGLFIAKRLVEGHGGRIWAESRPGDGAVFRILLPANPAGERAGVHGGGGEDG